MIVQPFTPAQLAAMTAGAPVTANQLPAPGSRGYRIWNLTAAFFAVYRAEGDSLGPQDIIFPWQYVEGSFDEALENQGQVAIASQAIPFQVLASLPAANYFFGYAFTRKALPRTAVNLAAAQ